MRTAIAKKKNNYFDDEQANLDYANFEEPDDRQYKSMLPTKKGKLDSLSYFKNSNKYSGSVKHNQEQVNDHIQDIGDDQKPEQSQDIEHNNGIKQALTQIKNKRKQRSKLLQENLKEIDQQDRQNIIKIREDEKNEGNAEALQNQLNQFNKLAQIRYYSQKNLQSLKKYPIRNYPQSDQLHLLHKQTQKVALSSLEKLIQNYQRLAHIFFYKQSQANLELTNHKQILINNNKSNLIKRLNVEALWEKFEQQTKQINQKMEDQIVNWSQRTILLKNSTSKSQYNSLLMQTPVGQAKKVITDWEKVSKKCQMKRSPFKILFELQQNLREHTDQNIYDDLDLFQQILKVYEQQVERGDKDFLINDTLKYLQNKSRSKQTKDVDRKASKNRKVRYNVHAKLLNFMPSQGQNLLQARDQIVKNLFNKGTQQHDEGVDYIDI